MPHAVFATRRLVRVSGLSLLFLVLVAAAINVPWALTFMRSRTTVNLVPSAPVQPNSIPARWPAATPHATPWPPPDDWVEGSIFGCRVFDVRANPANDGKNGFSMELQLMGWPLPVIEQKQMWWDWDDPALKGPESDPALSLRMEGLLLNPLLLGGGAWAILVLPWVLAAIATRRWRSKRGRCLECGYPIGVSAACTECGAPVEPLKSA